MPKKPLPPCSILLLAGGRGQRMGGADKGLLDWHGKPLIVWLHEQVRPLSDDLIISCNRNQQRYVAFADQLVSDSQDDFPGPLAGILAGLRSAHHPYLLVLACDAPLIDQKLLHSLLHEAGERPVVVRQGEQWQPLLSLWPTQLLGALEDAWANGQRSPLSFLRAAQARTLDCPQDDPRLANLNTPALLEQAVKDRL